MIDYCDYCEKEFDDGRVKYVPEYDYYLCGNCRDIFDDMKNYYSEESE